MAKGTPLEKDVVDLICECYRKGEKPMEISRSLGISSNNIYKVLERNGLYSSKKAKHAPKNIKCPKCKCQINYILGAKFCYKCGGDIRDEGDILIEKLSDVCSTAATFPCYEADKAIATINEVIAYIRAHK